VSDYSPILHRLEAEEAEQHERIRQMIREESGEAELARFDAKMRDVRSGVAHARMLWHSISDAQRRVLSDMERTRGHLWQNPNNPHAYFLRLEMGAVCRIGRPTVRALAARELLAWEGGAFTPEAKAVITERGLFLVKHGPTPQSARVSRAGEG
jgi:hypothetical protein